MKPHIRNGLIATAGTLGVVGLIALKILSSMRRASGDAPLSLPAAAGVLAVVGVVTALALSFVWWRLLRDAHERQKRPKMFS